MDELISLTRMIRGSVEQDIPVHELLHLAPLSAGFELIEAHFTQESPVVYQIAHETVLPNGFAIVAIVRDEIAQPVGPETRLRAGDKAIATRRPDCGPALQETLIGASAA